MDYEETEKAIREYWKYQELQDFLKQSTPKPLGAIPGWTCPQCGGGNAPFVQRCPCKPMLAGAPAC